MTSPKPDFNTP
jgi:hypothetical protein